MTARGMTPGPWEFVDSGRGYYDIVTPRRGYIGSVPSEPPAALADARLIAAVPDLLAALERVEKRLTSAASAFYVSGKASALRAAFDGWKDDAEAARAALARARGEEPHCPECGFPSDGPGECEACEEGGSDV